MIHAVDSISTSFHAHLASGLTRREEEPYTKEQNLSVLATQKSGMEIIIE
jgi:hypothetical protein